MTFTPFPLSVLAICWRLGGLAAMATAMMSTALAQDAPPPTNTAKPTATSPTPQKAASKPGWSKLSSAEQEALKPLASFWDTLNPGQQRKWLEISKNYPSLSLADQTKMHARMSEWASLTTQERAQARLNFAKTAELSKELSAAEKRAKWDAYQSLTAQEKQKLTEKADRKHLGAAPATQPVSPQKLAVLPNSAKTSGKSAKADDLAPLPGAGPATGVAATKPVGEAATTP